MSGHRVRAKLKMSATDGILRVDRQHARAPSIQILPWAISAAAASRFFAFAIPDVNDAKQCALPPVKVDFFFLSNILRQAWS